MLASFLSLDIILDDDYANHDEYYSYIALRLSAGNDRLVRLAAVETLSNDNGSDNGLAAVALLFAEVDDPHPYMQTAAIKAINSHYSIGPYIEPYEDVKAEIRRRSLELCKTESDNEDIRAFCGRHSFYRLADDSNCSSKEDSRQ